MKLLYVMALAVSSVLAGMKLTPLELNKAALGDLGDSPSRPAGHETKPYVEGLKDPYANLAEEADPHQILGE